jgi:hypothetical protein
MAIRGAWTRLMAAFAVSAAVMAACQPIPKPTVASTYRWVYSTGGIAGRKITPDSQHLSVIYSFVSDSMLFVVKNPGGVDTTRYKITPLAGAATGARTRSGVDTTRKLIHFRRPVGVMAPFDTVQYLRRVSRDTLVISDRCADCFEHTFVRITY